MSEAEDRLIAIATAALDVARWPPATDYFFRDPEFCRRFGVLSKALKIGEGPDVGIDEKLAAARSAEPPPFTPDLETYTDPQPAFCLSKEQREAASSWMKEHDAAKHIPAGETVRYAGAIGGAYTWSFTQTSLGAVAKVQCSCGALADVSGYNDW